MTFLDVEHCVSWLVGHLTAAPSNIAVASGEDPPHITITIFQADGGSVSAGLDPHADDCDDLRDFAAHVMTDVIVGWACAGLRGAVH